MAYDGSIQGNWSGRLIDVRGFEGSIKLTLKHNKKSGAIKGACVAEIGVNHASSVFNGEVTGKLSDNRLLLELSDANKERSVVVRLDGRVADMREGGVGLKGVFDVAAQKFSPLRGGVISASLNKPITSVAIAPEVRVKPFKERAVLKPKRSRRSS